MTEQGKTRLKTFSRRKFITAGALAFPGLAVADAGAIEPQWLKVRHVSLPGDKVGCRCVHFTDLHHKGDRPYMESVVNQINALKPDYVLFTGDIIENGKYIAEALELLSEVKSPMFGVPGNHDYWAKTPFGPVARCFASTGGGWLLNERRTVAGGQIRLTGITLDYQRMPPEPVQPGVKNILLMHYPVWADQLGGQKYDLLLAGHSHGGQIRLPVLGPLFVPYNVGDYNMGMYQTPAGPLYVNPGIGYLDAFAVRFNCRPEITVFDV